MEICWYLIIDFLIIEWMILSIMILIRSHCIEYFCRGGLICSRIQIIEWWHFRHRITRQIISADFSLVAQTSNRLKEKTLAWKFIRTFDLTLIELNSTKWLPRRASFIWTFWFRFSENLSQWRFCWIDFLNFSALLFGQIDFTDWMTADLIEQQQLTAGMRNCRLGCKSELWFIHLA
jgi:hypothetical protein